MTKGLSKFIEADMIELDEEDELWGNWMKMCREGISSHDDFSIRNLHANFVLLLAHAELNFAHYDGQKEATKLGKELKEIALLNTKYNNDKAMNARLVETKADEAYTEVANKAKQFEEDRALWKGRVAAFTKVVECLSREISYRIKK